jgi:hypothetical protein
MPGTKFFVVRRRYAASSRNGAVIADAIDEAAPCDVGAYERFQVNLAAVFYRNGFSQSPRQTTEKAKCYHRHQTHRTSVIAGETNGSVQTSSHP